jgi:outer membrane beta-barrel protein
MPMLLNKHRFALLVALATVGLPLAAQAQRKSPLADAPAIRKRFELRQTRFELGAGAGTTVNQDFFHTVLINVRLAFHITDFLAIAGWGDFGVAQVATGFQGKLTGSLNDPTNTNVQREPTPTGAKSGLQQVSTIFGGELQWTPFTGKYSLFGKLFSAYDFYISFPGIAAMGVKPAGSVARTCDQAAPTDPTDQSRYVCGVNGTKIGGTAAIGFHSYFGNSVALAVELRDVVAQLNPSGRDVNGDLQADEQDLAWTNTWIVTGALVVYLPFTAKVSP